ncbi:D-xylose 1-dehydrogenase (NADP(+)) [Sparassis crispa]|uniref:D-xylose 1-dehydrogenase (NADP(+), D-xylono-1,5-lactone-forming) n=1 Tax=Sparassis crispa TaxID=139825 RepID=A0A401GWM1_9APHY|nr:D-xylose 1-dehydrogenase (NADP(+)) [Sparassis crispa]GBE86569.1 D-xylose 1-dehydrogenase (NADP(+)) [Sparassis crispa]
MSSTQPFVLRWGIVSTGRIAMDFVKDLLVDPKTRGTEDVVHKVVGVGSRNTQKAQEFIDTYIHGDKSVKAYGTYADLFADKAVDAVYIGTPHTSHYENARDALLAGKHVLCEKPTTSNAAELKSLLALAADKKLFFMEAMWTRFQPLTKELKKIAEEGTLGDPVLLHADLAFDVDIAHVPKTHRMIDPSLGGGALLDLGPYPMIWTILALFEHPSNKGAHPTSISASMVKTSLTGVDSSTSWTVNFTKTLQAQAILSASITVPSASFGATIRYRNGNIIVGTPIFCPKQFTVQYFDKPGSGVIVREETRTFNYTGSGWHFEADEVARSVRDGKLESDLWTHEKSIILMETFDEVRRQGGYVLPPGVEKVL